LRWWGNKSLERSIAMMNPWDRERMWRESEPGTQSRGFASGMMWLVAIILGIFGMIAMAKSRGSAPPVAVIPVAISLFFIFMFMIGHRREQRRLAATRWQNAQNAMNQQVQEVRLDTQALPKPDDASLRRLYDRFDVKAIDECRTNSLDAKQITAFLEIARDFMDTSHAAQLIRCNNLAELEIHMHAALERAKLQFELGSPGAFKVVKPNIDDPPF